MKVRIIELTKGMPLKLNAVYPVKMETSEHYLILENDVWCGVYKDSCIVVEEYLEENGQLKFNL